jgi:hypothetical protein
MKKLWPIALVFALSCGSTSTAPTAAPPQLSGVWVGSPFWTLQVTRLSDNFQTSFTCPGRMTLSEATAVNGAASLSGFAVASAPCAPVSFDLTGTIDSNGTLTLTTGGPPPTQGPCPGGTNVTYSGQVTGTNFQNVSARGVTTVQCPEFGAHTFTYLLAASHSQ